MAFYIYFFLENKQTKWWSGCVTDKMGFGSIQGPCSTCQSVFEQDNYQ